MCLCGFVVYFGACVLCLPCLRAWVQQAAVMTIGFLTVNEGSNGGVGNTKMIVLHGCDRLGKKRILTSVDEVETVWQSPR